MTCKIAVLLVLMVLGACVETSVQPLTQSSFKIATEAEDMCGAKGTREIAFKTAAIEVIKRGADRFVVVGDQSRSGITGAQYTPFGGFQTYGSNQQDMVIQIVSKSDPNYQDALSARQTLGPDWQAIVAGGSPLTCF